MSKFSLLLLAISFSVLLSSCKKDKTVSIQSAKDNAQIETEFSNIMDVVAEYAANNVRTEKTEDSTLPAGVVVTFTDTTYTDGDGVDFILDYGNLNHGGTKQGILCADGRYRAGKIHVGLTDKWSHNPCTITIAVSSADGYYVGNGSTMYQVAGSNTLVRTSDSTFTSEINDATMQSDNGIVNWEAQQTITVTHNAGLGWLDNEYSVSGTSSGTNANGIAFTTQITTPLHKKFTADCMNTFVTGELQITNTDGNIYQVNYATSGSPACDNVVTVVNNGTTQNVTLW